jgi:hypothetical protein
MTEWETPVLHDVMPLSCQFSPSARLLWILLNRLILPFIHDERQRS